MLACDSSVFEEARKLGLEALELVQCKDDPLNEAAASRAVGIASARLGDLGGAFEALSHARQAAQRGNDGMVAAAITNNMGAVLHLQGRYAEARRHYHESLTFYERIGAKRQIASLWINLGDLVWLNGDGDWATASDYWVRAQQMCEQIGDRRNLAVALSNLAEGMIRRGEREAALPLVERTYALACDLGEQELRRDMQRLLAQHR